MSKQKKSGSAKKSVSAKKGKSGHHYYHFRDIDMEFWRRIKICAAIRGQSIRTMTLEALERVVRETTEDLIDRGSLD